MKVRALVLPVLFCSITLSTRNGLSQSPALTIGPGVTSVPLYGPWKFQLGDSPIDPKTGAPKWADPAFDDSSWQTVDLTPKGATDFTLGLPDFVPGWTAYGHPRAWGYGWYRIRLRIPANDEDLSLAGPMSFDDVYQVYANGSVIGAFGNFKHDPPTVYYAQPLRMPLPASIRSTDGTVVLAFRFWMLPSTPLLGPDAGGFHTAPILGATRIIAADNQNHWLSLVRSYAFTVLECMFFPLMIIFPLTLLIFDRSDRVYLWIAVSFLLTELTLLRLPIGSFTQYLSVNADGSTGQILVSLTGGAWAMAWWVWFRLQRPRWIPKAILILTVVLVITVPVGREFLFGYVPQSLAAVFQVLSLVGRGAYALLLLWIVARGIREQGFEGWLVLPAVLLQVISRFAAELSILRLRLTWFPFGIQIGITDIVLMLLCVVVSVLLLRRLLLSIRLQRRMALDVRQAQEVQQVILPENRTTISAFTIESEYRPALEVGGDFFQVIPHEHDGSILLVVGDVAGKGLQAGMLVAMMVGAIRTMADITFDPITVLRALNKRLLGRGEACATCAALKVSADGEATLANAGHLPPYLNGSPIRLDGSLPLGVAAEPEFSALQFRLNEADRLTFLSDGIPEAMDREGNLFGFDRVLKILSGSPSAAEIASAAQSFGQEDDISVVSLTRTPLPEPAAVS